MKAPHELRGRRHVVIDTMVLIYLFEDAPRYGRLCERLVQDAADGVFSGLITPITVAELLVKPLEKKRQDIADGYRAALLGMKNITVGTLSFETGCMAGALRAKYGLPLPDMIQVAFALQDERGALVTNDKTLRQVTEVPVFLLADMLEK